MAGTAKAHKNSLVAAAEGALHTAQREGENRTGRAGAGTAELLGGSLPVSEPDA